MGAGVGSAAVRLPLLVTGAVALATLAACGTAPAAAPAFVPATSAAASPAPSAAPSPSLSPSPSGYQGKYVYPVLGNTSYGHTHHDYPATDVMAKCGAQVVAAVDGVVLEVERVNRYDPKKDDGALRGGLHISILGDDGLRYYGSHFSAIEAGINPGVRVTAGQKIAKVGETGLASACHLHFGISPVCARTGDWWNRRGVIWPWKYLDSWKKGGQKSPVAEITAWEKKNGCPTKPTAP
ncbi:M23 family metallopeptidase [Catellatospora sp. TT07R-123]|uniref:M23 family metallopeptidase n=1 Tax=Catellatospora sp. TT07R-123 TaxID=2733863 RepID=UPI001BB4541E